MIGLRFRTMPPQCPQPCELAARLAEAEARVEFWMGYGERAQAEADRLASQLQRLGVRPVPLVDADQTDGWGA